MRVSYGRPIQVEHTFLDSDEETALIPTGEVTARIVDAYDNEEVLTSFESGGGTYTATVPRKDVGQYEIIWEYAQITDTLPFEVTAGPLFSVGQARNSDDFLKDATAFPAQEIIDYRATVEQEFERITGRSFVTRVITKTFTADGTGEHLMLIPDAQAIEAVYVNGEPIADVSGWAVSRLGRITYPSGLSTSGSIAEGDSVTLSVRYGFTTPPADVARAGMVRVRHLLAAESSGIPDRATTWQPEDGGTFRLATPGQGKWKTGIPEVDSTLAGYTLDVVLSVYAGG